MNNDANESNAGNQRIDHSKIATRKSFEFKTIIGSTADDNNALDTEVVVL